MLTLVSRASNAPVFYLYDTGIGHGSVGGRLISMELQGRTVANQALRVLAGEAPVSIPFGGEEAYINLYDWRELKRWQIPVSAIPDPNEIRFRQPTLWEQYRWYVIGALSLAIIETALVLVLFINLKRRKKAELELAESRMRLDLAADSAGAGLWIYNMATGRIWATDRARILYGFAPTDDVDFDIFLKVVHQDDRDRLTQVIQNTVRDNSEFFCEYRISLPDGSSRWMSARGRTQQDALGKTIGLMGAAVDISARKQMEESLLESEQNLRSLTGRLINAQEEERSRIARELHDDITQRLAVLAIEIGNLELLPAASQTQWKSEVGTVKNNLIKVSEDIHAISRKLHPSIIDDLGLVKAIQSESAAFTKREGVEVTFRHEAVPEKLPKDISLALFRVIQESLRNITRHSQAKNVYIFVSNSDNTINLSISDSGVGFDQQLVQNKAGLGLVSMRERVHLVGGTISFDSEPGEGTVINVSVPLDISAGEQ